MTDIIIRRPNEGDKMEIGKLFELVLTHTYNKECKTYDVEDLEGEIDTKNKYLLSDFASEGEARHFLIAESNEKILGTIEYGYPNDLILSVDSAFKDLVEVGSVFVHPDYQGQGIGNLLLNGIYEELKKDNLKEFCLDSGYSTAQKIWNKKFGEPLYVLERYWYGEYDHMIWRVDIS